MTNQEAIKMQGAIKAGLKETGKDHPYRDALIPLMKESCDMAIEALNHSEIPNGSGKDTNVPSKDIVYRQDVEDMLQNALPSRGMWEIEGDVVKNTICETVADLMMDLAKLPSAQPEMRHCVNCGRTVNNGGWYKDGGTRCPIEEYYALPKDGYCHLWEERNVTDDDYPERREG